MTEQNQNLAHAQGFEHAMLREIYEQPAALERTLDHYLVQNTLKPEAFGGAAEVFRAHKDLIISASGSSRHAGLAAEIMLEDTAGLSVDVEYASEYITRSTNTKRDPAVLVISQSGETADTLAALREAIKRGHPTLAVTNVATSTMMREASVALPTEAGVEKAIPATKSFTAQLVVLRLLSLVAAEARGAISADELQAAIAALRGVPAAIGAQLDGWSEATKALAERYHDARTLLFLGRGIHYAIAREGALKLKESSYIHAEGYPAGELKHGPNALVSDAVPLVVIATHDPNDAESEARYEKTLALLDDMRKQGARTIVLANRGDEAVQKVASDVIEVDAANEYVLPILEVVPLQLFSYFMAIRNGVDVDRPRNLVKSVVVE
ncbi:glucosamine--fructose-6-phosphate aminotransferase (isomerizing) [Bryocella elongata]|uniref:Glutamine--fructose-6-phosphate aminotransferase [isomerizing] n=1 Tax=Bryocella elongata TaxID=863522 RepID=A0A1H5UHL9_9BACT|nr:SIS domain-containing protein [Bryocella elongata]SEF74524.1 glucosamine--fructose-6-phosphate aminotransferase (isomerizing) [Bryocella elongata]